MKQIPVLSGRAWFGRQAASAIVRTSDLVRSPSGKRVRASESWPTRYRKYDWSFVRSRPLEETEPAPVLDHPGVVSGGDPSDPEIVGVPEQLAELDLLVAPHVGIGRPPRGRRGEERLEHPVPVLGREVDRAKAQPETGADRLGFREVVGRGALALAVVLFPVLHEHRLDGRSGVAKHRRGHRRIDAAGQPDHHPFSGLDGKGGKGGKGGQRGQGGRASLVPARGSLRTGMRSISGSSSGPSQPVPQPEQPIEDDLVSAHHLPEQELRGEDGPRGEPDREQRSAAGHPGNDRDLLIVSAR